MEVKELKELVEKIVKEACQLKNRYTQEVNSKVNYACLFAQSQNEYNEFYNCAQILGKVVKETPTGPLFQIFPLSTETGDLQLLKVRRPDPTRTELGDADFTVENYEEFKRQVQNKKGFKVIVRPNMEMIELMEDGCTVRAYFSNPPLDEQLGIK